VQVAIDPNPPGTLLPGKVYFFRTYATNLQGQSVYSEELRVAASRLPDAPNAPVWVIPESSSTQITVEWNDVVDKEIQTSGYILYVDNGNDGDY